MSLANVGTTSKRRLNVVLPLSQPLTDINRRVDAWPTLNRQRRVGVGSTFGRSTLGCNPEIIFQWTTAVRPRGRKAHRAVYKAPRALFKSAPCALVEKRTMRFINRTMCVVKRLVRFSKAHYALSDRSDPVRTPCYSTTCRMISCAIIHKVHVK